MKTELLKKNSDPTAQKVAETGYLFSKATGAEVTLLHAISDPVYFSSRAYSPVMGFREYYR